ncbi:MAG: amidohydrolase [Deltaproteobacteria bacterium]|nr:amidohydrolase [Deltaproteobacteria bacterium]
MMDRYLVVSSDGHAGLHAADYRPYVDPKYRDAFDAALPIQIEATQRMSDYFLITEINEEWRRGRDYELSGAWDPTARDKVQDGDGVAVEVLFPDGVTEMNAPPFGAGFNMRPDGTNGELMWAGCDAHNRFIAEFVQTAPERRIGLACIPVYWDVDLAVEKTTEARKNGVRGVLLPPMWGDFDAYHYPKYDRFWSACQDLEMPVHFHSGPAPMEQFFGPMPPGDDTGVPTGAVGAYLMEVHVWLTRPLTFMLWGGVFDRFPGLKVAITEGTSAWVPDYLERLEFHYAETRESQKLGDFRGHLTKSPAETFGSNVMIGASCMSRREAELRHEIGVGNIMWGSDYPHPEGSWPVTRQQQLDTFHGMPEEEIEAMLGGNAVEFYGIDAEKLAPLVARIGPEKESFQKPRE